MQTGNLVTRRQLTGRVFITPAGDNAAIDLGNLLDVKLNLDVKRTDILEAQDGFVQKTGQLINEVGWMYELKCNEYTRHAAELHLLAEAATAANQAAGTGQSETFTDVVQGRSYRLAKQAVSNVTVSVGGSSKTVDVDYTIHAGTGMLTILEGGGVADGDDVLVSYDCAAVTFNTHTGLTALRKTGAMVAFLKDQHAPAAEETHTALVDYYISDRGNHDGKKFNEFTLVLIARSAPTIKVRTADV